MEHYRAIDMFDLILIEEVPEGYEIFHTLWAHAIKFEDSVFKKLNPRWCLQGGSMDRELYRSFTDTVRWHTVLVIVAVRCAYAVIDFHFDVKDAFQATRTDEKARAPKVVAAKRLLFCYQAPGFVQLDHRGRPKVCRVKVGMQGAIDSMYIFGEAISHDLLTAIGCRRALWDRQLWLLHYGPDVSCGDDLVKVLARGLRCTPSG